MDGASPDPRNQYYNLQNTQWATDWLSLRHTNGIPVHCIENKMSSIINEDMEKHFKQNINVLITNRDRSCYSSSMLLLEIFHRANLFNSCYCNYWQFDKKIGPRGHFCLLLYGCLTRTGNYQIHEFDWLKSILLAI